MVARSGLGRGLAALMPTDTPVSEPIPITSKQHTVSQPGVTADNGRPTDVFFSPNKTDHKVSTWDAAASGGRIGLTKPEAKEPKAEIHTAEVRQFPVNPQSDLAPVKGARFAELPIGKIKPNSKQPRTYFAEADLAELVDSIKQIGVLQPIVVRESGDDYELIMGERRWRASTAAGLAEIPAIIRETDDTAMLRDALLENLHRANLNPLEEATAYRQLLDDFECTQEELATRIARSRPQISNTLRLLKLPPLVQRRVATGSISAGHARALLGLNTPEEMEQLAQQIVSDGLSVRAVEEIVANQQTMADPAKVVKRAPRLHLPESREIAQKLSERFRTNVRLKMSVGHGQIAVDFKDVEDLNRVLELLAPGWRNAEAAEVAEVETELAEAA